MPTVKFFACLGVCAYLDLEQKNLIFQGTLYAIIVLSCNNLFFICLVAFRGLYGIR